jgi:hypothetical protein
MQGDNNVFFIVAQEDPELHTVDHPFCSTGDLTCPCRQDEEAILEVMQYVRNGLMSFAEGARFIEGKML